MEKNTAMGKQSIRNKYLGYRNGLTVTQRREKSEAICDRLKTEAVFWQAEAILVYMNYRSEVETTKLVEELLAAGEKKIYAPKVEGMDIRFYRIRSMEDLKEGYQGIREPNADSRNYLSEAMVKSMKTLVLVPGAVFDRERSRMGYGKGFYDRFLAKYTEASTVSLAFECQIARKIPTEVHDRKVDMIITENEVIK